MRYWDIMTTIKGHKMTNKTTTPSPLLVVGLDRKVRLRDVIEALSGKELGYMKGCEFIESIKPNHGSCCCCMTCGQYHDDCVCQHNELLAVLLAINEQPNN